MKIRPRKVKPTPAVDQDQKKVGPRSAPEIDSPPEVWRERYVAAVGKLKGAPQEIVLKTAELLAEELGISVRDALVQVSAIIERAAKKAAVNAAKRAEKRGTTTLRVRVEDLLEGDTMRGAVVRSISVSRSGTGAVVLFKGRGDDDGLACRKGDVYEIERDLGGPKRKRAWRRAMPELPS